MFAAPLLLAAYDLPGCAGPTSATNAIKTATTFTMSKIIYPQTKRVDVVEEHFGQTITDPYRWLENDVRTDRQVAAWVEAQNQVTAPYLAKLPGRDIFRNRLTKLFNYERFTIPVKKGGRYFYFRNSGAQNQRVLYVRDSVDGEGRVLIDPNTWSKDGANALAEWAVSSEGAHVAYAVQEGGTDWRTIKVLNVNTGTVLGDELKWARFTSIAWAKDLPDNQHGNQVGFFYARYPEPAQGASPQASVQNHAIYFHALGTPQSKDRLVYASTDQPVLVHSLSVTHDGRYLAINSLQSTAGFNLQVIDLKTTDWKPRALIESFDDQWAVAGNVGTKFYLMTNKDAPLFKVVAMDIAAEKLTATTVVPEQGAVMNGASLVGGRLLITLLVDVKTEVRRYTLDGTADGVVKLPGVGTAIGFEGSELDAETFFGFTSFNAAGVIYRYDVASNTARVWSQAKVAIDLNQIAVSQIFYRSKDGTRVPMAIVRRNDVSGPAPTVLYAYGGYGLIDVPGFSPAQLAWVEQGGVFAVAYIRGGGEYGKPWHEAGRRLNKQNVFDDFIAAGVHLKAQGITTADSLAILGASNGGLLMGAVVNQRPDLFAAALIQVGVLDMLRFDQFTAGKLWVDEYGSPEKEEDFRNLLQYSPYHNIASAEGRKAQRAYPAILATTADTDDRVVPSHSFKYVAALQAAGIGEKPHLIRIETRAGHGAGKPTDKAIEEIADLWAFAAHFTGLGVGEVRL